MDCRGCGRTDAWAVRTIVDGNELIDTCNFCSGVGSGGTAASDVYFPRPHACQNITDEAGKPIFFESKSHKAQVMREKGLSEVGDRVHGARWYPKSQEKSWYGMRREAGKLR